MRNFIKEWHTDLRIPDGQTFDKMKELEDKSYSTNTD